MSAYYSEFDPKAAAWLRELMKAGLIPDGEVDERDIREVRAEDVRGFTACHFFAGIGGWAYALRLAGWPDTVSVWTGSCPCQPFSNAGKRKGHEDERHLWPAFSRLIEECGPSVVFGEQVEGAIGRGWFDPVSADLERLGYAVGAAVLPAAGIGAPHGRHRLYFVADRDSERFEGRAEPDGPAVEPEQHPPRRTDACRCGVVGDVADTDCGECRSRGPGRTDYGRPAEPSGLRQAGVALGDASGPGSQERPQPEVESRPLRVQGSAFGEAEPVRGFWRGADWIYCRDGKYRAVEPGTFPLAHGVSGRVAALRGYGNAICPQAAAEFVKAWMDVKKAGGR